ncbi:MAG: chromosome segregation protein SMC, partial [Bacteroidota bacterium]
MRLKSLEIKGFKSFADKTILSFDEGVTGIIGPNGCGKSNIIDSIRWVIGEQKISHLRSENLESLVFNGSKSRSASGLAEVSLTFENTRNLLPTEFNTVTVTRKFYKSGESEYRLNDVQCRLKDIQNLFLDTGVSTDSYAIIELGMVDDIIKDKDNSRRRMLEQAAGITIYKTRKKEAKSKLDATEQDLARIEDLLFEINNQLKTLENQAKKAEKYHELKKEYKILSIELAKAALEGFQLSWKTLNEQLEAETNRKIEIEAGLATGEAAMEQEKADFIEKERELQQKQQDFNELLQQVRIKENEKSLAQQSLRFLQDKEKNLNDAIQRDTIQLKGIDESILFSQKQLAEEEKVLHEISGQLEGVRQNVDATRIVFDEKRLAVDTLRKDNQQIQRQHFDIEKQVAVAETGLQNQQRLLSQLKDEQQARAEQLQSLDEEKQKLIHERENKTQELSQLQEQHNLTKDQILEAQSSLEKLRAELADENRKLDSRRNEHALLKSLIDSMEGYPDSVKFLHNNAQWKRDVPLLSDVMVCKEEYRTAIESLLEPYLNYYVVDHLQEAVTAVNLLHANQKGKANFFILDQIHDHPRISGIPEGTVAALDVVDVEDRYRSLANYLLGNVIIAADPEQIEKGFGGTVLDQSGKYFRGKYTLSGGSVGLFEGKKIGRSKNLERLHEEIVLQEKVVLDLQHAIQMRHNEVIGFNQQLKEVAIKETETAINQLINKIYSVENKIENLNANESRSVQRIQELEQQITHSDGTLGDNKNKLNEANQLLADISTKLQEAEDLFRSAEAAYNLANGSFNEINLNITRQQSKVSGLAQELEFKRNQLQNLKKQIDDNTLQLSETDTQKGDADAKLKTASEEIVQLLGKKEIDERALNEADQAYYNLRNLLGDK